MGGPRWLVIAVVGCYGPSVPAGAPCDPSAGAAACPAGQHCVAIAGGNFCETTVRPIDAAGSDVTALDATDAPHDATADDVDGDGYSNQNDNCPDKYNPDQGNEDGDAFGDVCDPCPPVADDAPADSDSDGVADACDPHPLDPGDSIVLFEGFHHGIPAGWTQTGGTWVATPADAVTVDGVQDQIAMLTVPSPALARHETVSTSLVVGSIALSGIRTIGVLDDADHTLPAGVECAPIVTPGGGKRLQLFDLMTGVLVTDGFSMATGDTILLKLRRDVDQFSCDAINGIEKMPSAGDATDVPAPEVGFRVHTAGATFQWLMVVAN